MASRRDLQLLALVAVLGVLVALLESVSGVEAGVLHLAPMLVLLLPLLAGRYLGEDRLVALVRAVRGPRRRPVVRPLPVRRSDRRIAVRGGRLLAASLAERGPPVAALAAR